MEMQLPESKFLQMRACWGPKPSLGLTHYEKTMFVPHWAHLK